MPDGHDSPFDGEGTRREITRREILRRGAFSAAALGIGGLAACGGDSSSKSGSPAAKSGSGIPEEGYGTIKFFDLNHVPFFATYGVKAFEKKFPGSKVELTSDSFATAHDKMISQMHAGQFEYDVAYTWAGWLAEMQRFATPLTELGFDVHKSGLYKDMLPGGVEAVAIGDLGKEVFYGLPRGVMSIVLHYNKELLDKRGVPVPKTWPELEAAASELTGDGVYGYGQGLAQGYLLPPFQVALHAHGGRQHDADGNVTLNTPQAIDAVEAMTRMAHNGSMPPASLSWAFNIDTKNAFLQGKIAMTLDYSMVAVQANDPKQSKVAGKIGSTVVPAMPPVVSGQASEAIGEGWIIPKASKNPQGALALLKFMSDPAGLQQDMLRQVAPSQVYDFLPAYKSSYEEFRKDPDMGEVVEASLTHMADGAPKPIDSGHIYSRYNRPLYQQMQQAIEAPLALALRKQKSPKDAMDEAVAAAKAIVATERAAYPDYVYRSKYGSG